MNISIVVDASVWVSWFRPSDINHETSRIWMEKYNAKQGTLIVPTLLLVEVAASISRRTGQAAQAIEAINQLHSISTIQIVPMDDTLLQIAVEVATNLQLRAGDAIYVALASQLSLPLVSWDKEQLAKAGTIIATYTPDTFPFTEEPERRTP